MTYAASRSDRAKAAGLVAALHLALGAALIFGLRGKPVQSAADGLRTADAIEALPLSIIEPPPPVPADSGATEDPAPPNLQSDPAPIIAPEPAVRLPVPSPVRTAELRAPREGADPTAGAAAVAGPGTGAGGDGSGFGGGGQGGLGAGSGAGGADARLLSGNLTNRDYRRIRDFGSSRGQATLGIAVGTNGRLVDCRPVESSGNPALDQQLCYLLSRTRWAPATDRSGQPVTAQLRYVATWESNYGL